MAPLSEALKLAEDVSSDDGSLQFLIAVFICLIFAMGYVIKRLINYINSLHEEMKGQQKDFQGKYEKAQSVNMEQFKQLTNEYRNDVNELTKEYHELYSKVLDNMSRIKDSIDGVQKALDKMNP